MSYRRALPLNELWIGEMRGTVIDDVRVLLVHGEEGVYAFEDRCAHKGVPLSSGRLERGQLVCGAHGWVFDACTGKGVNPACAGLRRLPVLLEGDVVYVDVGRS